MSERVSWVTCPHCEAPAALGWKGNTPVEFDCRSGCRIADADIAAHFPAPRRPVRKPNGPDQQGRRCPEADDALG